MGLGITADAMGIRGFYRIGLGEFGLLRGSRDPGRVWDCRLILEIFLGSFGFDFWAF